MAQRRLGIVMNGVTGRMGTNQHLIRSIVAIRAQGGVALKNGDRVMPDPILVGRNQEKVAALAKSHGISRVTTNKYVHTPQGLFELKYFFNSSIRRVADEDIASESVKQAIKKIIDEEDKVNPLSDQQIVELLAKRDGIQIARRTVAKYREMLGILSSSKRKKLF